MKQLLCIALIFLIIFTFLGCAPVENDVPDTFPLETNTPSPRPNEDKNPISGPISNSNYSSAFSDATSAVTMFMSYQAAEGVAAIDDGVIFVVEKGGSVFYFEYSSGELEVLDAPVTGEDITPTQDGWLSNVSVYKP